MSFVDAAIAMEYLALSDDEKARVDPMITGFNPTDMLAADHIRRVLLAFPGVFSGIGEFSVHKEFVSSKVAGHTASLRNPALGRILEAMAEIGLVAIIHCDIDRVREGERAVQYDDLLRLLAAHPGASVIWARPAERHLALLDALLSDTAYDHALVDISWSSGTSCSTGILLVLKGLWEDPRPTKKSALDGLRPGSARHRQFCIPFGITTIAEKP